MFLTSILFLILSYFYDFNNKTAVISPKYLSNINENQTKLLIILVDGFRWDYGIRDKTLKGFPRIAANGVRAQYVKPIFPANSAPNWYAITTGLYAENHGIIQNYIYDQKKNEYFLITHPDASHQHWWNQTQPLWISAEKQGVRTSMYCWEGCQVTINRTKASYCYKNKGYVRVFDFELADRMTRTNYRTILDDFSQNKYRLSMLYHEVIDPMGHVFGPDSDDVFKSVRQIDAILNDLFNEIIERKLHKTLNVVIVSDHGMTELKTFKRIRFEDILDFNDIELLLGYGSGAQLIPKPDKEEEVYNQLSKVEGIKVYRKSDIPQELHYKNNRRVLPLLVTADFGYSIKYPHIEQKIIPDPNQVTNYGHMNGNHGYDSDIRDMRAIMYAFGPAFKKNFISEPIKMVDHYNLFCHLLGITAHPNNGSFDRIIPFLKNMI